MPSESTSVGFTDSNKAAWRYWNHWYWVQDKAWVVSYKLVSFNYLPRGKK